MRLSIFIISLTPIAATFASPILLKLDNLVESSHRYEPSTTTTYRLHNASPSNHLTRRTTSLDLAYQLPQPRALGQRPSRSLRIARRWIFDGLNEMTSTATECYRAIKTIVGAAASIVGIAAKGVIAAPRSALQLTVAWKMALAHVGGKAKVGSRPIQTALSFGHYMFSDSVLTKASGAQLSKMIQARETEELGDIYEELRKAMLSTGKV
ncbi:hypothetical protein FRB94_008188 [Tulasnella sp. JGI-2019a]|nr:hypothetical protein FRB93_007710 [Tulasnella sp. JGI-2019a]KAG8996622.1 hypothetical protein FRB94_008188 [Tulasnella sp. JGI-2019a]KAG9021696.1 hypothetical protein FRB95_001636 [Tulasnella sp. JGI-2019a]